MRILTLPPEKLIDIGLEIGLVPDAKFHYRFEEFAGWQIESLIELGLKPGNTLLDIGCGPLRLGIQAINYLDEKKYFGIDGYDQYLKLGKKFVEELGLKKNYEVLHSNIFEFEKFKTQFDFANAQSVFTHMSREQILLCMSNLKKVMKKGGIFLFTNIVTNYPRGFIYLESNPMISGSYCTLEFYQEIAKKLDIEFVEKTVSHPTQTAHLFKF